MSSTAQHQSQITVNGAVHPTAAATVAELIAELALDPRAVAIEQNRAIVARSQYAATPIRDGDAVEVVAFIGGG